MKFAFSCARLSVLSFACVSAFSASAQTQTKGSLAEVVVTASRFAESADALAYGVSVISAKDIASSGASSVSEAVMKILGVRGTLDTTGGNNYALDLRGFGATASQNQVVIVDGRRLSEQDQSTAALGAIAVETIEKIEVIRGNAAVVYGEGATGGAIIVTTKAGLGADRKNSAQLGLSLGNYGLREVKSNAVVRADGLSLDVAGSDRVTDGHRENFSSVSNSLSATLQWSNDWLRLGLQSGRNMLHSGTPGGLSQADYDANAYQANAFYKAAFNQMKNENSGAFLEADAAGWQFGLDLGERTKKYDNENPAFGAFGTYGYDVKASSANARARYETTASTYKNALVLGLDNGDWKRVSSWSGQSDAASTAVYITDDVSLLGTGTRLAFGYRNEALRKTDAGSGSRMDDNQNAWHFGLTQTLAEGLNVYGRTGQSFRLANVDEFSYVLPGFPLKPQTSRDTEIGVRRSYANGRVELRWFRSDLNNEIGFDSAATIPGLPFPGANVNLDPTQHQGLEFELHHALQSTLSVRLQATIQQSRFVSGPYAGNDIALVPKQTVALGASWVPAAGHTVDLGVNWISEQKVDFQNQCAMPAYASMDVHYGYAVNALEFGLGVKNLADSKFYTLAVNCAGNEPGGIYAEAGRQVLASMKLKF
jgi:iron complex outermembrane receptor protein